MKIKRLSGKITSSEEPILKEGKEIMITNGKGWIMGIITQVHKRTITLQTTRGTQITHSKETIKNNGIYPPFQMRHTIRRNMKKSMSKKEKK